MRSANPTHRVYQLHSEDDRVIPIERAEALFAALPQKQKTFVQIPNTTHTGIRESTQWKETLYTLFAELAKNTHEN